MAAAALGVAWFLLNGGGGALRPGAVGWLLRQGDPATHWLGFAFSRAAPWGLPLGSAPGYLEPLGTSVAMTDAIPLVALALRPLSRLLGPDLQYLGPWVALSFALQGWFGARLAAAVGLPRSAQPWGGLLLVLAPPLLWRVGHEALTSHWIVLAMLALALAPAADDAAARRALRGAVAVALLAATIHPTLATQAAGLACAVAVAVVLQGRGRLRAAAGALLLVLAGDAALFAVLGYAGTPLSARGYGWFSADLLALVNPMGHSRLLPSWPTRTPGQAEGFSYLGLGSMALAVLGIARAVRAPGGVAWRRAGPLLAVSLLFAAFAVSTYVTFAGRKVFGTSALPPWLVPVVSPFRASGRFLWPLHYGLVACGLAGVAAVARGRGGVAALLLAGAAALQVADLGAGNLRGHYAPAAPPTLRGWEVARGRYRHLELVPPRVRDGDGEGCGPAFGTREIGLAYRAYRLGLGIDSGYVARMDVAAARRACDAEVEAVRAGVVRADTIYVPDPEYRPLLARGGAVCGSLTGEPLCVAPGTALAASLAASP